MAVTLPYLRMVRFPNPLLMMVTLLFIGVSGICAGANPLDDDAPTLGVGVYVGGAPMAFFEHGVLRGLDIDLAQALADAMDMQLQLHEMPQPRLIDAVRGGRIDLMLSTLPETDLDTLGLIASEPLLNTGQMALIRAEDVTTYARPLDIITTSSRVGYQRGSAGARFVQANLPKAQRIPVIGPVWGIAALRAGDIDLFIHDATTVWMIATDPRETQLIGLFHPLTKERLAWIMRTEDQLLQRNANTIIRAWRRSGKLAGLLNRWIPIQILIPD